MNNFKQKSVTSVFFNIFIVSGLLFLSTACGPVQKPFDPGPRGTLRFKVKPSDAVLFVDETRLGPVFMFEKRGVLLKPGTHRIMVAANGYFKEYRLITVKEGKLMVIKVDLTEIPM
jgi:hypothetical protein